MHHVTVGCTAMCQSVVLLKKVYQFVLRLLLKMLGSMA